MGCRWERVEIALKGIVCGEGETSEDPVATIKERYDKNENDEFLKPIIVSGDAARVKGMSNFPPSILLLGIARSFIDLSH